MKYGRPPPLKDPFLADWRHKTNFRFLAPVGWRKSLYSKTVIWYKRAKPVAGLNRFNPVLRGICRVMP
jgi:hypothetical protein